MNISDKGIEQIQLFEELRLDAYLDSGGVPTIGFGTIRYPNGNAVKEGDTITYPEAIEYLKNDLQATVNGINRLTWLKPLNQSQFDSLCSFAYNLGLGTLANSTLYQKAKVNPDDETIYKYNPEYSQMVDSCEFLRFVRARVKGKLVIVDGLIKRRYMEADSYAGK